ncbi:hypothetical protein CBG46_07890 [Actinobacillus succinogenes]|nr:hypothetical protein CBG46_07890 [Actinobacillus succinogenes]
MMIFGKMLFEFGKPFIKALISKPFITNKHYCPIVMNGFIKPNTLRLLKSGRFFRKFCKNPPKKHRLSNKRCMHFQC